MPPQIVEDINQRQQHEDIMMMTI